MERARARIALVRRRWEAAAPSRMLPLHMMRGGRGSATHGPLGLQPNCARRLHATLPAPSHTYAHTPAPRRTPTPTPTPTPGQKAAAGTRDTSSAKDTNSPRGTSPSQTGVAPLRGSSSLPSADQLSGMEHQEAVQADAKVGGARHCGRSRVSQPDHSLAQIQIRQGARLRGCRLRLTG